MTRVDFYILDDQTLDASLRFACRLCLKGYHSGLPIHVHTTDEANRNALDELLWDYPKHRFLPHATVTEAQGDPAPIHISGDAPHFDEGLLINLDSAIPTFFGRFDRVAEIVVGETRDQGREHYKHYRDRGYPLHHHELTNWESA